MMGPSMQLMPCQCEVARKDGTEVFLHILFLQVFAANTLK